MTTLAELRALAERASKGPWRTEKRDGHAVGERHVIVADGVDRIAVVSERGVSGPAVATANAEHIAAASPDVVLALVQTVEELRAALTTLKDEQGMMMIGHPGARHDRKFTDCAICNAIAACDARFTPKEECDAR